MKTDRQHRQRRGAAEEVALLLTVIPERNRSGCRYMRLDSIDFIVDGWPAFLQKRFRTSTKVRVVSRAKKKSLAHGF